MKIHAIEHVQLAMPAGQENIARRFYTQLLGFKEVPKPAQLANRGGLWLQLDEIKIHLGVEANFKPAKKAHPAFLIDGVEELARLCKESGIEVIDDDELPGYDRIYVSDPFGNRLEFMQAV